MKVLVVGSGGREHALAWKIAQSPLVEHVYCAPGNPGVAQVGECIDISANDIPALIRFSHEKEIGLAVIGPEDPLAAGIVDRFETEGLRAWGPSAKAAQLEASKAFAKRIMAKYGIPTAEYAEFDRAAAAKEYVRKQGAPIVVKADGLAAGKGVTVAASIAEAERAIDATMLDKVFGDAGGRVVIEECLLGEEASIFALCDGAHFVTLASSQDHKRIFDNDEGPNTGGMGAYSPAPVVTPELMREIEERVLRPCVDGMANEGAAYRGVLYAGLMITADGPKVIEFNCRFGDPETQVVLPRMKSDLVPLLLACRDGALDQLSVEWHDAACVTVVMASGGYPGAYEKGKAITGIADAEKIEGVQVFHAGAKVIDGRLVTNGGRVLNVTATDADIPKAITRAYEAVACISFEGAHYRKDIGRRALHHL